jgi:glycosyltransferase involved in cell wall biosynthesis
VEERQQQPSPGPARQAVIGGYGRAAPRPRDERRHAAGRAARVMGVDHVRAGDGGGQPGSDRVGGVPEVGDRPQDADAQPAVLGEGGGRAEGDEPAVDVAGEGARELEGIALAAAEDPGMAERGGRDVDDPHLVLCLVTLGDPRRLTGGYLYHLRMAAAAPRHGARIVFRSFPARPFPLPGLAAPRVLGGVRAGVILLDSIAAAFAGPWLALRAPAAPVIGVLHQPPGGIDHGPLRTRLQAPLDRLGYRHARLLIVAGDLLADQLAAAGVDRERIRVVPPGRDVAAASGEPGDLRRGRRAAFLCVANWMRRKGILELLDAYARLPPDLATLHLAGSQDDEPRYAARVRQRLARLELAGRVVVHGPLSRERVAALYAGADAFVLPAFREPYGTVWGEAMAFGLPVLGWRAGNLPYLAPAGREALLVPPGDIGALGGALHRLATDEPLRRRLGEAARRRAQARPTWEESAALFFTAIRSALP